MQRKWRRNWQRAIAKVVIPPVAAGMVLMSAYSPAAANPTGGTVTSGAATISATGNTTTVTQTTDKAAINWQSFSIGAGEKVQFLQPGASSIALNRVLGSNASNIYGTLTANGRVYLINPNGILFAPGSQVNVGGLVASTLNISDSDFMNGKYIFEKNGSAGSVTNQGTITADDHVVFIGPQVNNEGVVAARVTALAAGNKVSLDFNGDKLLNVSVDTAAAGASVANSGTIKADGGLVVMSTGTKDALLSTVVNNDGVIRAQTVSNVNGVIRLEGDTVINSGTLDVSGQNAGQVNINAAMVVDTGKTDVSGVNGGSVQIAAGYALQAGAINADGTENGGSVDIKAGKIIQTRTATINANGGTSGGSIKAEAEESLLSSADLSAKGTTGGQIDLLGKNITLLATKIDTSGLNQGGQINIGGDYQGQGSREQADTVYVNAATTIDAGAKDQGNGGQVVVWSNDKTEYYGTSKARGGDLGGNGGLIEVSGKNDLVYGGAADAGAPNGVAGKLLLDPKDITIVDSAGGPSTQSLTAPIGSGDFGASVSALDNGNIIVTDPTFSAAGKTNIGAVYLFSGNDGSVISTLTGSNTNDFIGFIHAEPASNYFVNGVTVLTNGNFVVASPYWNSAAGAVTWASKTSGVTGIVSSTNSLVGSTAGDQVGGDTTSPYKRITALTNGNYVVGSTYWQNSGTAVGAATWVNGSNGQTSNGQNTISSANSLIGGTAGDMVGANVTALTYGNYVVGSYYWHNSGGAKVGAATWVNGSDGQTKDLSNTISATNSLVGSTDNDLISSLGVVALTNGNYVVQSPQWSTNKGAATWGDGAAGTVGIVSQDNSLVGSTASSGAGDRVGTNVTALSNGNYVVGTSMWDDTSTGKTDVGAATWVNGTNGQTMNGVNIISGSNSVIGSNDNDQVSGSGIKVLTNGNYVINSPTWQGNIGASTWGNGSTGTAGTVSSSNSLVGTTPGDKIGQYSIALSNGNYVALSQYWSGNMGAATWGNGSTGITGTVSSANSLVGSTAGDQVGSNAKALTNGNYVILSQYWNGNKGAATWSNGTTGITGTVSSANSLVGSTAGDNVGQSATALTNGNYVVSSPSWSGNMGAATWGNGTTGTTGTVSAANSLVGSTAGDKVGLSIVGLSNGNYVVASPYYNSEVGAISFGDGAGGTSGTLSSANSVFGTVAGSGFDYEYNWDAGYNLQHIAYDSANNKIDVGFFKENKVYLVTPGGASSLSSLNTFAAGAGSNVTAAPTLLTQTLNTGTNVTLQANNDININSAITVDNPGGNGGNLTMQAGRSINVNANIITDNGNLTMIANEKAANGVVNAYRDTGAATITMAAGTSINAGSGTVSIELRDGAGLTNNTSGDISMGTINANTITAVNWGTSANSNVVLNNGATLTASGTGDAIVLAASNGVFKNNSGSASPFSLTNAGSNKRWLVYAATVGNIKGGITSNFRQYGTNYGGAIGGSGNGFIYSTTPSLTVTTTNSGGTSSIYGNTPTASFGYTLSGFADNEDNAGNIGLGGTANFSSLPTSSTDAGNYTVTYNNGLTNTSGYTFTTGAGASYTVEKRPLTVTANVSRVYGDANPTSGAVTLTSGSLVGSDALGPANLSSTATATSNVGNYNLTPSGVSFTVGNAGNYTIIYNDGILTVAPAALTVTANNASKTYGQTTAFAGTEFTSSGLKNGETIGSVTLNSAGAGPTAGVAGSPYAITASNATGGTFNAGNYTITYNDGVLTITPAALMVTANNASKTYGQTTTFAGTEFISSGLKNGETIGSVTLNSAGAGPTAGVAGSPYTITASNATGGTFNAGNYTITYNDGALTITPAALTVTANNASKTYGQTTTFAGTEFISSGLKNGETIGSVTLNSAGASPTAGVAGLPYAITASNATGGTFNAGNYTITYNDGALTVTPAALTVTANNASKTYGQTITFAGTEFTSSGLKNGETIGSVTLNSAGAGATADVAGSPYAITASNATGGTFNAGNYTITYNDGALTITPRALTVTATGVNKTYDGMTNATVTYGDNRIAGDTFTISGTATFGDKNVGIGKNVSISGITLGGADAGNYTVNATATAMADITPAALTIRAKDSSKTVGQTITFTGTEFTPIGLQNGETVGSVTLNSAGTPASAGAGDYAITASNAIGGTFSPSNYTITYQDGLLTVRLASNPGTTDDPVMTGASGTALQTGNSSGPGNSGSGAGIGIGTGGTNGGGPLNIVGDGVNPGGAGTSNGGGTIGTGGSGAGIGTSGNQDLIGGSAAGTLTLPAQPGSFQVVVVPKAPGTADQLIVNRGIQDAIIPASGRTTVIIPVDAFAHTNPNASVTLSAAQVNGQPLPNWVSFNLATGTFQMQPPPGIRGTLTVKVVARDNSGHEAVTTFKITIGQERQG